MTQRGWIGGAFYGACGGVRLEHKKLKERKEIKSKRSFR